MFKNSKRFLSVVLSLVLFATLVGGSFTKPVTVSANTIKHEPVHADISTFQKNFILTPAQKQFCISRIIRAVNTVTEPDMSDLEKYYRLALWENDRANYDFDFWSVTYNFDLYRHQWDAYGVLTDTSVCVGIAILYSILCHAADLPCKFVRTDPYELDHTINYIPNINGNAYLVDVTEASFLMSQFASRSFGDMLDKDFAYITKDPDDSTFEYAVENIDSYSESGLIPPYTLVPSDIKESFNGSYADWFNVYALHNDPSKNFLTPYVEKGSGQDGVHYASYKDYPKQFSADEKPGIWFLEDFYENPEEIESLIRNKTFDEQLVSVEGLEDSYDCQTVTELEQEIEPGLALTYFPTLQDDEIVPEEEEIWDNDNFDFEVTDFDLKRGEAEITIKGNGEYNGSFTHIVKLGPDESSEEEETKPDSNIPSLDTLTDAVQSLANAINTQNSSQVADLQKQVTTLQKQLNSSSKKANTLKVKGKKVNVKYKALKKKSKSLKATKTIKFLNKGQGSLVYAKASGNKNITVNSKTGKITVKKKLKKGTYKVKVNVIAVGDKSHNSSSWQTATITVRVK